VVPISPRRWRLASSDRAATVLRVRDQAWMGPRSGVDRSGRLDGSAQRPPRHRHGDLTATVHAGVTLVDLNRVVGEHGQWLPIDSAFDAATIGAVLATNDAGPLRHRFGTPRDLLIASRSRQPDGRLVKAGGHVVKNVRATISANWSVDRAERSRPSVMATFKLLRSHEHRPR